MAENIARGCIFRCHICNSDRIWCKIVFFADGHTPSRRPKSMAVPPPPQWDTQLARALYAYLSSGDNQLSFLEGDLIALIGDRNKGWQFGENLRTQCSGWFPLAYTEVLDDPTS